MEKQVELLTQYGKLEVLYDTVHYLNNKIIKEQEKLQELKKEEEKLKELKREEENGQRK